MSQSKQRYDVVVSWSGKTERSTPMLHCARWLPGKRTHSQTACGKSIDDMPGKVDYYVNSHWHVQPTNQHLWCQTCRSAAIANLDTDPASNTGSKPIPPVDNAS